MRLPELVFAHYIETRHLGTAPVIKPATRETRHAESANLVFGDFDFFEGAYKWMESKIGFYPLFMLVGLRETILEHLKSDHNTGAELSVLVYPASSDLIVNGRFLLLDMWPAVANDLQNGGRAPKRRKKQVLIPHYDTKRWLRKARKEPFNVEFVLPEIDVRAASEIITIPASG